MSCPFVGRALGPLPAFCQDTPDTGRFTQVATTSHSVLWPRAISEDRLHEEEASTIACDFSFDAIDALPLVVRLAVNRWTEAIQPGCAKAGKQLLKMGRISVTKPDAPLLGADEAYLLNVSSGRISINAPSPWGALHALTSLEQLFNTSARPWSILPMVVNDAPTYKHRGIMVDPARNYLPMPLLKKLVDGVSKLKLNVLHLDLINAPSFPFVAPSRPEFAEKGAYPGLNYTAPAMRSLVKYGVERGVLVLLEVDTPGHSFSWGLARPELTVCDGLHDQRGHNCPEPPCGYMKMGSKAAQDAAADVVGDIMDLYTPFTDRLGSSVPIHLGADEVSDWCFGKEETKPLFQEWVRGLKAVTTQRGRPTVTWMESWSAMSAPLSPADSTLQFWGNAGAWPDSEALDEQQTQMQEALDAGFDVIYSNASEWYLDCGRGNFLNGKKSWCDPYKSWQVVMAGDPRRYVADAQKSQIVGGEVCLWGEQTDPTNLEQKLWQRAAAAAERLWAPADALVGCQLPVHLPLSGCWKQAHYRLRMLEVRMRAHGFAIAPSQPLYCTLAPEMCDMYH